jgi:AcrR family transcriptional regulator
MSKGEATRNAIVETALSEASRSGLDALSIGGLARELGMSKSGVFAHFESKEDLQLKILEEARHRFVEIVIAPALKEARGLPRIRALFENWLRWQGLPSLPGGCIFIAIANELDDQPGRLRDALVASQRDWLRALATAASIAVEEGHFHGDVETGQFAYDMYSIALAYHHFDRLLRDPRAEARARTAFAELIKLCRAH